MPAKNSHKAENKITLRLISVLIAVSLWFIISYTEDPVIDITLSNIKIEYRGINKLNEKGMTIPNAHKLQNLAISVNGSRSSLIQTIRKAKAYVDVSDISEAGTYTLDINLELPTNSVTVTKQKMKTLDVTVERVVSKDVPVVVKQTDKNKDYLVKSVPQQQTVHLTGPESLLSNVSCVMAAISTIDMKTDNMQKYSYRIMDSNNSEVDDRESFTADSPYILIYNELYTPKSMNVELIIPDSVSSMYDVELVQSPVIAAGVKDGAPDNVTATFPENAITQAGTADYTLTVNDENNVYVETDNKTVKARVQITKKELQYVQIPVRFKNVPDGYTAWCDVSSIDTYINCVPQKLASQTLVAYADVSGLSEGRHEVTLTFEQSDDVKIIGDYHVNVILSKKN